MSAADPTRATRSAHEHDPPIDQLDPDEEAEVALAGRLGDEDRHLIDLVKFGADMELWSRTNVGRYFIESAEQKLNDAVRGLLEQEDLTTQEAKTAHFNGRVALDILRWFDEAVSAGREAEEAIIGRDFVEGRREQ